MDPLCTARARSERLIAGYLVYSLLLVLVVALSDLLSSRLGLATHLIDISVFTLVIYLTEAPSSPFFVYFVFALFAAALRWRWRGLLWTALATLAIFIALGLYADFVLRDPLFELNRFIIRSVYLAVIAILLGYLSAHEQRLRGELARLAAWPHPAGEASGFERSVRYAASVLDAPRAVIVWEDAEEPWCHQATLARNGFESIREPAAMAGPLVAAPLQDVDFLCLDARSGNPVLHTSPTGLRRWRGRPLAPELPKQLASDRILSVQLQGEYFRGRLFFLDKPAMTADDLVLGEIVARQVSADLNGFYIQQRLQRAAVSEERVRFARELHDGVLQFLTGLALQLKVAQRLLRTDTAAADARLVDLRDLVAAEQADLRLFVRQMQPLPLSPTDVNETLVVHLEELARRAERQWDLQVELSVGPLARQSLETLAQEVYRILQEALANAARHGQAKIVRANLCMSGDRLQITVADDGRGFPFRGRRDLAALARMDQGPVSLRERVASLGGDLIVDSSEAGARLEIALPLAASAQAGSASDDWPARAAIGARAMPTGSGHAD